MISCNHCPNNSIRLKIDFHSKVESKTRQERFPWSFEYPILCSSAKFSERNNFHSKSCENLFQKIKNPYKIPENFLFSSPGHKQKYQFPSKFQNSASSTLHCQCDCNCKCQQCIFDTPNHISHYGIQSKIKSFSFKDSKIIEQENRFLNAPQCLQCIRGIMKHNKFSSSSAKFSCRFKSERSQSPKVKSKEKLIKITFNQHAPSACQTAVNPVGRRIAKQVDFEIKLLEYESSINLIRY